MSANPQRKPNRSLGTWEVMVAGVAPVLRFLINFLLGKTVAGLSVAYPKAGALFEYARAVFSGRGGRFIGVFPGLTFFGVLFRRSESKMAC